MQHVTTAALRIFSGNQVGEFYCVLFIYRLFLGHLIRLF